MAMQFNIRYKEALDTILLNIPGVTASKMFGLPAYKANGKTFACVYGDGVVIKLPEARVGQLVGTNGITAFEPEAGRVWREWVLIMRPNPDDYRNDMGLFQESIRFVA